MSNGYLKFQNGVFFGKIVTLTLDLSVTLKKIPDAEIKVNGPTWDVFAKGPNGGEVIIGSAWEKQTNETKEGFLSITMDDPSFPAKINVAAFKRPDGTMEVVWQRPKQKQAEAA